MEFEDINGAKLAYEVMGSGEALIFVHGYLASSTDAYYADFKNLLAQSYRLYALDMRGHGGSATVEEDVTLEQCARDISSFADALGLDRPYLVGHSMGGFLALAAAIQRPGRFKAIAAITPAPSKGEPFSQDNYAASMAARKNHDKMDKRFGAMFVGKPDQSALDACRNAALRVPDAVADRWLREEWPNTNITEGLASLDLPVLSIIGTRDAVVSPRREFEDAALIPDATVVAFSSEGHMLPLERPDRCMTEISRFFQNLP